MSLFRRRLQPAPSLAALPASTEYLVTPQLEMTYTNYARVFGLGRSDVDYLLANQEDLQAATRSIFARKAIQKRQQAFKHARQRVISGRR